MNNDKQQNFQPYQYKGDEISLVDLWRVITKRKSTIIIVFIIISFFMILKTLIMEPVYESRSVIQIGKFSEDMLVEPALLMAQLGEEYQVDNISERELFFPRISSISIDKTGPTAVLRISSNDVSAEGARVYLSSVVSNILSKHKSMFDKWLAIKEKRLAEIEKNIGDINLKISEMNETTDNIGTPNSTKDMMTLIEGGKLFFLRDEVSETLSNYRLSILKAESTKVLRIPTLQPRKIKPKMMLGVILGLALGLLAGILAAFFHEFIVNAKNEILMDKINEK